MYKSPFLLSFLNETRSFAEMEEIGRMEVVHSINAAVVFHNWQLPLLSSLLDFDD